MKSCELTGHLFDFAKATMLGVDTITVSYSALQTIGCFGMQACGSYFYPVGITTQKESLRLRIETDKSTQRLANYLGASSELKKVVARACGHNDLEKLNFNDLSTSDNEMHKSKAISYAWAKSGVANRYQIEFAYICWYPIYVDC